MSRDEAREKWEALLRKNTYSNVALAEQLEHLSTMLSLLVGEMQQTRLARRERLRRVDADER
jgi:hypothetical protein